MPALGGRSPPSPWCLGQRWHLHPYLGSPGSTEVRTEAHQVLTASVMVPTCVPICAHHWPLALRSCTCM